MRRSAACIIGAVSVSGVLFAAALVPQPAAAQGLFDLFFGIFRPPPPPRSPPAVMQPYADPRYAPPADAGEGRGYGSASAYCVRSCDGHFFPVSRNSRKTTAEVCKALCPAAKTRVFQGSGIDNAVSVEGEPYPASENAFVYRERIVDGCSCNGKTPFGLARIDVASDPTLRQGDIVATRDGLKVFQGERRGAAEFTPISRATAGRLGRQLMTVKVAPGETQRLD